MKKILLSLLLLTFLLAAGCSSNQSSDAGQQTQKTYTSRNGLKFDYPLGWQILHRGYVNETSDQYLGLKLKRLDEISINFERPHDIGPYDGYSDVTIRDLIFETPKSPEEFLKLVQENADQKGAIEKYKSKNGIDFRVLHVSNLAYEADYVFYITEYTNQDGKHLIEISRMNAGFEKMEKEMKPMIDSFQLPN